MIKDYELPPNMEVLGSVEAASGSPIHSFNVKADFGKYDILEVYHNIVASVNSASRYFYFDFDQAGTYRVAYNAGGLDNGLAAQASGGYAGGSVGMLSRAGWNSNCYVYGSSRIILNEGASGIVVQSGTYTMEKSTTYIMSGTCGSRFVPTTPPAKPAVMTIGLEGSPGSSFYGSVLVLGRKRVLEGF